MKRVLLAAVAAIALTGAAHSKAKHTWFSVNYAEGKCTFSAGSPEDTYNSLVVLGPTMGVAVDRIAPENVTKDDKCVIHVHMTGDKHGEAVLWDFFSTIRACEQFISDEGIKPSQADSGDIN
jgi:hypothetical protein